MIIIFPSPPQGRGTYPAFCSLSISKSPQFWLFFLYYYYYYYYYYNSGVKNSQKIMIRDHCSSERRNNFNGPENKKTHDDT